MKDRLAKKLNVYVGMMYVRLRSLFLCSVDGVLRLGCVRGARGGGEDMCVHKT